MQSKGALAFIFTAIRPFRVYVIGMMCIALTWAFLLNVQPYIVKLILNAAMGDDYGDLFHRLAFLMGLYLFSEFIYVAIFRLYD